MKPKPGDTYRLATDEPLGNGELAIPPGTLVTVREIVKAEDPGAHDDTEDAVVVEGEQYPIVLDRGNGPEVAYTARAWSVGLEAFARDYTKEG